MSTVSVHGRARPKPLVRSFERHLRALNRSERTIATYLIGLRQADAFRRAYDDPAAGPYEHP